MPYNFPAKNASIFPMESYRAPVQFGSKPSTTGAVCSTPNAFAVSLEPSIFLSCSRVACLIRSHKMLPSLSTAMDILETSSEVSIGRLGAISLDVSLFGFGNFGVLVFMKYTLYCRKEYVKKIILDKETVNVYLLGVGRIGIKWVSKGNLFRGADERNGKG